MNGKMFGKVKWFKENKGYGYIIGYDDESYYFEISSVVDDTKILQTDDEVQFIPYMFSSVPYAEEIEIVKE